MCRLTELRPPAIVPPPAGGRWYAVPKGERVLKVLKFDAPSARGVVAASPQILKNALLSSLLLAHPHSGGRWRAQRDGRGRLRHGPLCGPGSEDSGRHRAPPWAARVRPGNGFRPLSESDAQPATGRRPQPSGCSPVNPHTEGVSKGKKQKWHRPTIGGQDSDGVSNRCSALYTLCLFEAFTHREACHWIRGSLLSPMNPVPLPPQGETRSMERKNRESYISCTIPQFFPPLVVNAVN